MTKKGKINLPLDFEQTNNLSLNSSKDFDWQNHEVEGQLAVDVAEDENDLVITATMAGTPADKLELHLQNDLLTIRGERTSELPANVKYFYQECFWGKFSRTIVLPADVKYELAQAEYKNGVLTIRLPKRNTQSEIPILVVDE